HWHVMLRDGITGQNRSIRTRALVNAAGAFVAQVGGSLSPTQAAAPPRLVKGSHIVVRRLYDHDACYTLQNADGRVVFVIPYEQDFTLIGTTDQDFTGDPAHVRISAAEIAYLCQSASTWLRAPVTPSSVVWSYAGVRALYDDGSATPQQATRDYVLQCDAPPGDPPLLSVFGGKITTYRRLAESALALLGPYLPPPRGQQEGWTGRHRLPGGDFPADEFDRQFDIASTRFPFIPPATLKRLLRAYGTEIHTMFGDATCSTDLGAAFGAGLTEAELRHLIGAEWARTAEDVVWRRSKLGLRLSAAEIDAIEGAMRRLVAGASDARQQAEGLRPFEPHQRRSL
ncbi:MAG TPA: glycerol-3-phosphate dehydrogenase, partial [Rhodopila sp.]|nr:glycerol-3-phosphate dehydrogenase [Rhodopila sp.]